MSEKSCETCPFVLVCDGITEIRDAVIQEIAVYDAEGIIVDAKLAVNREKSEELDSAVERIIPWIKNDPVIVSINAKRDQLNAKREDAKLEREVAKAQLIGQMTGVSHYWIDLKNSALESCIGRPREHKRFKVFGKTSVECASVIGRKNMSIAVSTYKSSIESLVRFRH